MEGKEKIGYHKGALESLINERNELGRLLQIVDALIERHAKELKDEGVNIQKYIEEISEQAEKQSEKVEKTEKPVKKSSEPTEQKKRASKRRENRRSKRKKRRKNRSERRKRSKPRRNRRKSEEEDVEIGGWLED